MALNEGTYPFSGGVHHGNGRTLSEDDIHKLTIMKAGEQCGEYDPIEPDKTIDIPEDTLSKLKIVKGGEEIGEYDPHDEEDKEIEIPDDLSAVLPIKINDDNEITNNGVNLTVTGTHAWAEGNSTKATGVESHAEGYMTEAGDTNCHAEGFKTVAKSGSSAHAEGSETKALAWAAHSEGYKTKASAAYAHSEGHTTEASGNQAHAEGAETVASGSNSHAEGYQTVASGFSAHAEGASATPLAAPKASGNYSHAEGTATTASGLRSHAEGESSTASGAIAHAEGLGTTASGAHSHSEGDLTEASGVDSHAEGLSTKATGIRCHAEGTNSIASGNQAHAEGYAARAHGETSHVEGSLCIAKGTSAHAEGGATLAIGKDSHAEGYGKSIRYNNPVAVSSGSSSFTLPTTDPPTSIGTAQHLYIPALGFVSKIMTSAGPTFTTEDSVTQDVPQGELMVLVSDGAFETTAHSEGYGTFAKGYCSHAEGYETLAGDAYTHAEGHSSKATGAYSHAEGHNTLASDAYTHAEGSGTQATETYAHAEGYETTASGTYAHSEGFQSSASGEASHAGGLGTLAPSQAMTAIGKFNTGIAALFAVGNGADANNRKDVLRVDTSGNLWLVVNNLTGEHLVKVTGLFAAFEISNSTRVGNWSFTDVDNALQAGLIPVIVNIPSGANARSVFYYTSGTYDGMGFTYHFDLLDVDYPARYSLKYDDTLTREAQYIDVNYEVHTNNNTVTCDRTYDEILPFINRPDKIRLKITYYNSSNVLDSYYNNALVWIGSNTPTLHFRFITHGTGGTGTAHIINHKADNTIEWG